MCPISHVSLMFVIKVSLTHISTNYILYNPLISVNRKTLLVWLIFHHVPGHPALWPCFWLQARLDLKVCFVFSFSNGTLWKPCRNQLIKDGGGHCGVIGIGNYWCHEEGERSQSGAYVSVPYFVKPLAKNHLDQTRNRIYWADLTCSVWPLKELFTKCYINLFLVSKQDHAHAH